MAQIDYQNEAVVDESDLSLSILDVSVKHGIPHVHACGGNARCSTCRVLVVDRLDHVCPRNVAEASLAERRGLPDDIRLACQAHVIGDVTIRRLVVDDVDTRLVTAETPVAVGRETNIAVLFADIRGFTPFSERTLAYDVVHILNRYFQTVGEVILANDGVIDKYIGDAIMALFGLESADDAATCRSAVRAAVGMRAAIANFNDYLDRVFHERFEVGIGVHFGPAVVGSIGHAKSRQMTAIGDTVNVASRVESAAKNFGCQLLVTEAVHALMRDEVVAGRQFETGLRGKSESFGLVEVLGLRDEPVENTGDEKTDV